MTDKQDVMQVLNCSVNGMNFHDASQAGNFLGGFTTTTGSSNITYTDSNNSLWNYWQNQYYPYVIRESYPVYIQERAMDKGKHAFELLKALMDKNLMSVRTVKDFVDAMDIILKNI